jgi:hypothetical protein
MRGVRVELPETLTGEGVVLRRLRPDDGPGEPAEADAQRSARPALSRSIGAMSIGSAPRSTAR